MSIRRRRTACWAMLIGDVTVAFISPLLETYQWPRVCPEYIRRLPKSSGKVERILRLLTQSVTRR